MGAPLLLTAVLSLSTALTLGHAATGASKSKPKPKPAAPTADDRAPQLTLPKGIEVTVEDWDAKTETFALELQATPAVGPNFVTPESLRQGIAYPGDLDGFMKQKNQMIGSIYQLKNPTPLVREDEMKRREAKGVR